jgi:hypothetical protein
MNKITAMNPTQKHPAPEPKCPFCETQPVRYDIVTGFTPPGTDQRYAIVQLFCADCKALLTALPAPIPTGADESPFGPRSGGVEPA